METAENKLFEGLSVTFHWTEGAPIKLRSGETVDDGKTFYGEDAYEVLVALAMKDKELYEKSCLGTFLGYDKCKISLSLASREGNEGLEYNNCRIALSELNLNCGGGPLDSLAWRFAGQETKLYNEISAIAFGNSYHYDEILEDERFTEKFKGYGLFVAEGLEKDSAHLKKEARKFFLKENEEILNAFSSYLLDEDKYLTAHPELRKEFQENQPMLYKFLIKAQDFEKYAPKCQIIDFEVAKNLDGKVYAGHRGFDKMNEYNFDDGKAYNNDYYIVTSAFNLSEWERTDGKFMPYFTKEEYNALQNIYKLKFTEELEQHPFKYFRPTKTEIIENELKESEIPATKMYNCTYAGKMALEKLEEAIYQESRSFKTTLRDGYNYEEGKNRYLLKYDNKLILDETSHSGIDVNLVKQCCCSEDNIANFIPMPNNMSDKKEELKKSIMYTRMYFPSEIYYDNDYDYHNLMKKISKMPTLEQMNNNRIKLLQKTAKNINSGLKLSSSKKEKMINAIMALTDSVTHKTSMFEPKGKNQYVLIPKIERFAVAFTITAAKLGFNQEGIKYLVNEIKSIYAANTFGKKVSNMLRTKGVKEIIKANALQNKNNDAQKGR